MYPNIEFNPAAFKHGVTENNIRWVLWHHLFDSIVEEDDENKYLVLGFDEAGNLLEIMYNFVDERTINVFHAMKCRKAFYSLLDNMEE
ncbi:MAG: hypothetical protein LBP69_00620 [Treponema sp.]|jgi:uncharacterized DUF497 family protein|nr:hypothetical protein [Treponema sp.]